MKKSLIALAIAGTLTAPVIAQADATLYGTAQYRGTKSDDTSFNNKMAKTRLGVKGTVDNDIEGLTTNFQFEWEFDGNQQGTEADADTSVRKSLVQLKGGFGIISLGRQDNPANAAEEKTDILGNNSAEFDLVDDRVGQTAAYITPKFGGAHAYVGAVADGGDAPSKGADATVYGVNWSGMGFGASVGVVDAADQPALSVDGSKTTTAGVSYSGVENLYVAASYSQNKEDGTNEKDKTSVITAAYTIDKVTLGAYHAQNKFTGESSSQKVNIFSVMYALGAMASIGVEYADFNAYSETYGTNVSSDADDDKKDTLVLQYTLSF